ncbi:ATP-binding protein [Sphingomonas sp. PR090111-T3T-6A]|uniref:ATP-binding protein n=1 Tax=Sphingomonas sp. PR090111-T3T-6A TaxID=685778 RepID=UPI00037C2A96
MGRDAGIAMGILAEAAINAVQCATVEALVEGMERGAGFGLATSEALESADLHHLRAWIDSQPEWSDFPFILLTRRGGGLERNPEARRQLEVLSNVAFLERPFHPTTLISLAQSALRGRRRQYEARARLQELHALAGSLERQVEQRTADLRRSEARLRAIFETNYQYQGLLAPDGTVLDANRTALEGIGATLVDVVGRYFWETPWLTGAAGMKQAMRRAVARVAAGETIRQEATVPLPTGLRIFDFGMRPVRGPDGSVISIVPEAADITERRQAEEALRQAQKLEAMGQLTGGVAHDFNNLLTPIVGGLDILQRSCLGTDRQRRLIDGAIRSAERAKVLVQRLLAFARRQPLQPTAVDVASLVKGMADLVATTTGPQIRVMTSAPDDLPPAHADANQLEMAILNLSVNARDAMPEGGTLRITASEECLEPTHQSRLPAGRYIRLSVADTGTGMDEETLARAIEPFFSTKGVGKGTGLGLSMAHGLALQLNGALTISSKPDYGTNIDLWLPLARQPVRRDERNMPSTAEHQEGVALLVDDEELVRASTAHMLSEIGYAVVEAGSAEEALALVDQGQPFDVLVTDHLMPGLSGVDLVRTLQLRRLEAPALIISGYADAADIAPDLLRITKPFRQEELAAVLSRIVASG